MAPRNAKDDSPTRTSRLAAIAAAVNKVRKNRHILDDRGNGKMWHTRHLQFLYISFRGIKHENHDQKEGCLSNEDHMRIFHRIYPDMVAGGHSHRRLLKYYNRRFKTGYHDGWYIVDRPNGRRKDSYTKKEKMEFAIVEQEIQEAADTLGIEMPWAYAGDPRDVTRRIRSHTRLVDEADEEMQDAGEGLQNEEAEGAAPAQLDTRDNVTSRVGDPNDPSDFNKQNTLLLPARLTTMDRELDSMDWSLPETTAVQAEREARESEARRRLEHPTAQEVEVYRQRAVIMGKLCDQTDPYVRCCGEWSDKVLGRPLLHLGEGSRDEKIFGFKTK